MNNLEEVRQVLFSTFKSFHAASFAVVPVNYPNYLTIDAEHLDAPFVSVQLSFNFGTEAYDISSATDIVRGELLISYLYPEGTGLNRSMTYSDMLRSNFCFKKISGISFKGLKILEVSPAPGIVGQMNVLGFLI